MDLSHGTKWGLQFFDCSYCILAIISFPPSSHKHARHLHVRDLQVHVLNETTGRMYFILREGVSWLMVTPIILHKNGLYQWPT